MQDPAPDAPLPDPMAAWLRHLESNRRYSPHTLDGYRRELRFLHALAERAKMPLDKLGNGQWSLSTGINVDDHGACEPDVAAIPGIHHLLVPENNLLVQSAIVARARRFVGTYGGFAYLAPFYGVPTEGYYTEPHAFSVRHLDLACDVFATTPGCGQLRVTAAC